MQQSRDLFERAQRVIPGGVNSPVRAFQAVGGTPVYMAKAKGARMTTADGVELVDFCGSWGPLLLGHARGEVVAAIQAAAAEGTSFGANTAREVQFAERLCRMVPSMDKVRLVSSGTEATMTALRLARGFTGRDKIVKFQGGYHGHSDGLLAAAGSGLLTGGIASSAGVSSRTAADVLLPPYNDLEALRQVMEVQGRDVAAVIVEPIAGNMGLIVPDERFLSGLRELTEAHGALLILDEVITGFRLAPTTYGQVCGSTPDLTCLGKIIGGGMPIGAVGGRADVMSCLAPLGDVYQAGTLSGNPVAVAAGLATLEILEREDPYPALAAMGTRLRNGLTGAAARAGVPMHVAQCGGMFTPFFAPGPIRNLVDAKRADTARHARFFHGLLDRGFYLPPSQFEVGFISSAHSAADIDDFIAAAAAALGELGAASPPQT